MNESPRPLDFVVAFVAVGVLLFAPALLAGWVVGVF